MRRPAKNRRWKTVSPWKAFDIDSYSKLSPNRIVAYNLIKARAVRGLTQEQAADRLERFLKPRWSKSSFSAAERSVDSGRTREFTADEILAFARAFDLPVMWFFLPPDFGLTHNQSREEADVSSYLSDALGSVSGTQEMEKRFARIYDRLPEFREEHEAHPSAVRRSDPPLRTSELLGRLNRVLGELQTQRDHIAELVDWVEHAEEAGQKRLQRTQKRKKRM